MRIPSWLEADPSLHPEAVYIEADRFCHQKILLAIGRRTIHTALRLISIYSRWWRAETCAVFLSSRQLRLSRCEGGVVNLSVKEFPLTLCGYIQCRRVLLCVWLTAAVASSQTLQQGELAHSATGHEEVLVVQEGLNQVIVLRKDAVGHQTVIKVGEKPHEVAISKDGRTAYISNFGLLEADHKVGTPGTTISVIDVVQKRERARFILPAGVRTPHGLKIRPGHPNELFTNAEDGREEMVVFNTDNGTVLRTFALLEGVHNFIFSDDGADCYAFTTTGSVVRLNPDDGHILVQTALPKVRGLALTTDHTHLLAGGWGQLLLLNPKDLTVTRTYANLSVGQIFYPSASPDGRSFFLPAVLDGVLLVVDALTGDVRNRIVTGSPLQVVFDGNDAWISNVKIPTSMLPAGASERPGGLVHLDLFSYQFRQIEGTEDANGIAIIR